MTRMTSEGRFCSNRLFEWFSGTGMCLYGCHVMLAPEQLTHSRYAAVLLIFTPFAFGLSCAVVGFARVLSLYANGNSAVWGPRIRVLICIPSGLIWLQLAVALNQWWSPGMWFYYAGFLTEMAALMRAARDRNARRA